MGESIDFPAIHPSRFLVLVISGSPFPLVAGVAFFCLAFFPGLLIAAETPLSPAEKRELATYADQLEQACLKGIQVPSPAEARDYPSRVALLMHDLVPPGRYCSCSTERVRNAPAEVVRERTGGAFRSHIVDGTTKCMAEMWREGFVNFCNGLRKEMFNSFGAKLGAPNTRQSEAICGCAGSRIRELTDQEFGPFLANSSSEVAEIYAALDKRISPSNRSMSGILASCGANTMADAFGISAKRNDAPDPSR